ncbi:MAG: YdcH family protein [Phenylobacterium sp.]
MTVAANLDTALSEEFADQAEAIHALKARDPHFHDLLEQNHKLWLEIRRIEKAMVDVEDRVLEDMRKSRLAILDQIAARLQKAAG